jgi:hypothetical protein
MHLRLSGEDGVLAVTDGRIDRGTAKERQARTDDQNPEHRHSDGHDHTATPSNSTTHPTIVCHLLAVSAGARLTPNVREGGIDIAMVSMKVC